jgi:glutamine synthetase
MKLSIIALLLTTIIGVTSAFAPIAHRNNGINSPSSSITTVLRMVNHLEIQTGRSQLDTDIVSRFNSLPYPSDKILAEYVWVDAKGECRSKTRTLPLARGASVDTLPKWNFDGSSTGQAPGDDSEVILRPCRIFKDPFRPRNDGVHNILVMCDCYTPSGMAIPSNTRAIGE